MRVGRAYLRVELTTSGTGVLSSASSSDASSHIKIAVDGRMRSLVTRSSASRAAPRRLAEPRCRRSCVLDTRRPALGSGGSSHTAALLSAPTAGRCAALAVLHVVLFALDGARVTYCGAELAKLGCEPAAAAHVSRRQSADIRAISIEPDALGHGFDVIFFEARARAVLTFLCAFLAGFDAILVLLVGHSSHPFCALGAHFDEASFAPRQHGTHAARSAASWRAFAPHLWRSSTQLSDYGVVTPWSEGQTSRRAAGRWLM